MVEGLDVLRVTAACKSFPGVQALKDVSLSVRSGEVHGIVGENGAGKSTLIKSIMGVYRLDSGRIEVREGDSTWVEPTSAVHARSLGLFANYQSVNIARSLSIGENYFIGRMPLKRSRIIDWKYVYDESAKTLERFGLKENPRAKISELSLSTQEMIMVSKMTMIRNLKLAIFDEPTAFLEEERVTLLFEFIRALKERGISVVYISHRLEEVTKVCDRITVLRDGQRVDTRNVADTDKDELISLMVGRSISNLYDTGRRETGNVILEVNRLSRKGKFKDVSFVLHRGEIFGVFGLIGAGGRDLLRCIYGAQKSDGGEVRINGEKLPTTSPHTSLRNGLGFAPEDRANEGLAFGLSIEININMTSYGAISKLGVISLRKEAARARGYVERTNVRTPSLKQMVSHLSGGNQQKVLVSKLLCADLDILMFEEPTAGVDVGARQEIYRLLGQFAAEGKGVILVSAYLPEVIGLSDRILVMADGSVVGEVGREQMNGKNGKTEEYILKLASKLMTEER